MATIATRPLPHHFAGAWGPEAVADLEEDLIVVAEDLGLVAAFAQGVSDRVDALVAAPKFAGVGPPGGAFWGNGEDGADGFPGAMGPMGPAGLMGLRGFDGADGEDGMAWPGPQGTPGLAGVTASTAPTTTGTETALAIPTGTGNLVLYLNNATLLTVQGIAAGIADQLLFVYSKGAGQVDFAHLHASGTALGKLKLFATVGLTSLAAGSGVAVFQYDAVVTQWRLVAHEQGAWITGAFSAGDFTGSGAMTWTVDAGDVLTFKYRLLGRTLTMMFNINTSTVGGTAGAILYMKIPAGFACALSFDATYFYSDAGGAYLQYYVDVGAGGTTMGCLKQGAATWTLTTNLTQVFGTLTFEVQ